MLPASAAPCSLSPYSDAAPTELYTLSLHDALPISTFSLSFFMKRRSLPLGRCSPRYCSGASVMRSEEHTSELQSLTNLVCRLLLEKKNSATDRGSATSRGSMLNCANENSSCQHGAI